MEGWLDGMRGKEKGRGRSPDCGGRGEGMREERGGKEPWGGSRAQALGPCLAFCDQSNLAFGKS